MLREFFKRSDPEFTGDVEAFLEASTKAGCLVVRSAEGSWNFSDIPPEEWSTVIDEIQEATDAAVRFADES